MRCIYRERLIECGDYLEVDIFPVYKQSGKGRKKRAKPTSETQANLNQRNAERELIRLLHANFTEQDIVITLTYRDEVHPETYEESWRDANNFLRRVKRLRDKLGLPKLKYILVPGGKKRFHFHIAMNGGLDRTTLEKMWGFGYANTRQLQFDENGVTGLGCYISRQFKDEITGVDERDKNQKRFSTSKNLVRPEGRERDGRISRRRAEELATVDVDNRGVFEKLYKGYTLVSSRGYYNEVNGEYYLALRMVKSDAKFSNSKMRKRW